MVTKIKKGSTRNMIRELLEQRRKQFNPCKKKDIKKYCGAIKLTESPMDIQKTMRNEWE